ncbi:MAG TPA: peptidoglycan DD-metalloendopeptidase family protein [Devosiaceae bacterium]|nr:peptidoglycan DD-metalloendopeptidase family protein [Devosiaceae bacterium]
MAFRKGRPEGRQTAQATGIRPALFYGVFAALCGTNVITLVALFMAPEIAGLMSSQRDLVLAAYEDRVAELRTEVDRLHSRQYAQTGNLNLQLQELTQQQEVLLEQHQYVRQLALKAAELGLEPASVAAASEEPPVPALRLGSAPDDIETVGAAVQEMMEESRLALAGLTEAASDSTETILAELRSVGITPALPTETPAIGGPLLPAQDAPDAASLADDANAVMEALSRYKSVRSAIGPAPLHRPLAVAARRSSNFGNRRDPFTRAKAFHAGIDFAAPSGTTVLSTGRGKVVFAGRRSGYGNLVEIDHGGGLSSRYAHLSAFLVKAGQRVESGTPIARVGSTGRSTGPHLHFEIRRKNVAVDPTAFLDAGQRLRRFLGS